MKRTLALSLLSLLLATSYAVAAAAPVTATLPGSLTDIKEAIASALIPRGFSVTEDAAYRMVLVRPTSGKDSFVSSLLLGNAASDHPDEVLSFELAPREDGVLVVLHDSISVQFANGIVHTTPLTSKKQLRGQNDFLAAVKSSLVSSVPRSQRRVELGADFNRRGAPIVVAVTQGSPASVAGLLPGDALLAIDTKAMDSFASIVGYLNSLSPGDAVHITIRRKGAVTELAAVLAEPRSR